MVARSEESEWNLQHPELTVQDWLRHFLVQSQLIPAMTAVTSVPSSTQSGSSVIYVGA